jgi:hypothetical protein
VPQRIEVRPSPGPAPSDSFYGEPPAAGPSVDIVDASSQPRRGPCGPDRRGRCDSGEPQDFFVVNWTSTRGKVMGSRRRVS